ncbi:hypothetical protein FRC12_012334 [Ceratobasidium sp. 428]|nr:hypothetical protein FRC12_012334 [Ceratobasidium sp. 428]
MSATAAIGGADQFYRLDVTYGESTKRFMVPSGVANDAERAFGEFTVENSAVLEGDGIAVCSPSGHGFQMIFKNSRGQEGGKFICDFSPYWGPSKQYDGYWVDT